MGEREDQERRNREERERREREEREGIRRQETGGRQGTGTERGWPGDQQKGGNRPDLPNDDMDEDENENNR